MGWVAGLLGPPLALTIGGLVSIAYAGVILIHGGTVRDYRGAEERHDDEDETEAQAAAAKPVEPPDAEPTGDGEMLTPPTSGRRGSD